MKRKAEEEATRSAIDALERRKSERARLANYMREGRAAPKQIHISREVLSRELGGGDENALPSSAWPERASKGGENVCRESVPAGVEDRKRVLRVAQHNGRGVRSARDAGVRKGGCEEESMGGASERTEGGWTEERGASGREGTGICDGSEVQGESEQGTHEGRGAQPVSSQPAQSRGAACDTGEKARAQEECKSNQRENHSESSGSSHVGEREAPPVAGQREVPGSSRTEGTEGLVQSHRRPRWNTRVIQEYETAKLLKARGWERGRDSRFLSGGGLVNEEGGVRFGLGYGGSGATEVQRGKDTGRVVEGRNEGAIVSGPRPVLSAKESPWLM